MNKEAKILGLVALVMIVVAGIFAFQKPPEKAVPSVPLDDKHLLREGSHMTGEKTAKVTLVEFGDYQCPACAAAFPVVEQIIEAYKDNKDFNFVFRNLPLSEIHPYALPSAEAAEAAGAQGKFWEMYRTLYEKQAEWTNAQNMNYFVLYAQALGLDADKLRQEVSDKKYSDVIAADRADATALGLNSTPSFFVNGEAIVGIPKFEDLKAKIDEKLK